MKNKNVATLLLVSSIFWVLSDLYWIVQRFTGTSWNYYKDNIVDLIISTIMIIVPISLLIFSISLANDTPDVGLKENEDVLSQDNQHTPSVGEWLVNFLIAAIPLVGFIFYIIWANDDNNRIRKNWAIASLIWTGIIFVLSIFFYLIVLDAAMKRY